MHIYRSGRGRVQTNNLSSVQGLPRKKSGMTTTRIGPKEFYKSRQSTGNRTGLRTKDRGWFSYGILDWRAYQHPVGWCWYGKKDVNEGRGFSFREGHLDNRDEWCMETYGQKPGKYEHVRTPT